jgi:hypothetical protein
MCYSHLKRKAASKSEPCELGETVRTDNDDACSLARVEVGLVT